MKKPPEFLQPILHSIEIQVKALSDEFPRMLDKDVEQVFGRLRNYYAILAKGNEIEEPEYSSEAKQALSDEIINILEAREEIGADEEFTNPEFFPGHPTVYHLYTKCFKRLIQSCRMWRKENGAKGYINFIRLLVI